MSGLDLRERDLTWRIEEACHNACPSPREIHLRDRWIVRMAGGATRRTNAVAPLRADCHDPTPIIDLARRLYDAQGLPTIFRVPSIALGMEAPLARAGFVASGDVSTLVARLDPSMPGDPLVRLLPAPDAAWLTAKFRLTSKVGATPDIYQAMVAAILLPKAFASVSHDGGIASVAYGAIHDGVLVVESVVTDPAARQRGYGRRLIGGLMAWASAEGAEIACLQVEADNTPACALYRSLGFRTNLYRYHYRSRSPDAPPRQGIAV